MSSNLPSAPISPRSSARRRVCSSCKLLTCCQGRAHIAVSGPVTSESTKTDEQKAAEGRIHFFPVMLTNPWVPLHDVARNARSSQRDRDFSTPYKRQRRSAWHQLWVHDVKHAANTTLGVFPNVVSVLTSHFHSGTVLYCPWLSASTTVHGASSNIQHPIQL